MLWLSALKPFTTGGAERHARDETVSEESKPGGGEPQLEVDGEAGTGTESTESGSAAAASDTGKATEEPAGTETETGSEEEAAKKPPRKGASQSRRVRDPALARAFRSRRPVEGKISGVIKGGYEVRVGRSRAFCPHSQIDVHRVENPEEFVGKTHYFIVHQYRRGGEDVVLSRRAYLEEEQADEAKAVRATLLEGSVMRSHVTGIAGFGVFVDLGAGVQGLVHISELSHSRVVRASDVVAPGDSVNVKILKLEDESGRISLSIRQAEADPWDEVPEKFLSGSAYPGTVRRITDFGAFIEMKPGVEALAPAREFPPSAEGWREGLEPGVQKDWLVLSVDGGNRRMSVIPALQGFNEEQAALEEGAELKGRVQRVERFGVFVWLGPGRVALLPAAWSGVPQGTRLDSRFPIAKEIEVKVVEIAEDGRKIRLALKGVEPLPEAGEPRRDSTRRKKASSGAGDFGKKGKVTSAGPEDESGFGTSLGDVLRAALKNKGE